MRNAIPFTHVNGIKVFKNKKFLSTVSNSIYFQGLMLIILAMEIYTTIKMCNFKVENGRSSHRFRIANIFFSSAFFVEFIFNFGANPKQYFKNLRNIADFIALFFSILSIYFENSTDISNHRNFMFRQHFLLNHSISPKINLSENIYVQSWSLKRNLRKYQSHIMSFLQILSTDLTSICTSTTNPFIIFEAFISFRLIRIFYLNKSTKSFFKSILKATIHSFPSIFLFFIVMVVFAFVGFFLYSETCESLFGNIFISIITIFDISTKDSWPDTQKAIVNYHEDEHQIHNHIEYPKSNLAYSYLPDADEIDENDVYRNIEAMHNSQTNQNESNHDDENESDYSIWFSITIVTVLGTILSTFVVAHITDEVADAAESDEKKAKKKAILKVRNLLRRYTNNRISWKDLNYPFKNPNQTSQELETSLTNQKFKEIAELLTDLKKAKEKYQESLKYNKYRHHQKLGVNYNYNHVYEYYNSVDDLNGLDDAKELGKQRREIEQLEVDLQYNLEEMQTAFSNLVKNKHNHIIENAKKEKRKQRARKRFPTVADRQAKKANLNSIVGLDIKTNDKSFGKLVEEKDEDDEHVDFNIKPNKSNLSDSILNVTEPKVKNVRLKPGNILYHSNEKLPKIENRSHSKSSKKVHFQIGPQATESDNNSILLNDDSHIEPKESSPLVHENSLLIPEENLIPKDGSSFISDNSSDLHTDDQKIRFSPLVNHFYAIQQEDPIIQTPQVDLKSFSTNNNSSTSNSDANQIDSAQNYDLITFSNASTSYKTQESYSVDQEEDEEEPDVILPNTFECFGEASRIDEGELDELPQLSPQRTILTNPRFIKAMKLSLKCLILDLEKRIELQSALITRISQLIEEENE